MSRPNVADWQYLGVGKCTLGLEWNCGREARKGHICEDTFAYGSYSSKDLSMSSIKSHESLNARNKYAIWKKKGVFEKFVIHAS